MAGIGDYVHLYGKNYLIHGTTRKSNAGSDASGAIAASRESLAALIGQTKAIPIVADIEKFLNDMLNPVVGKGTSLGDLSISPERVEAMSAQFAQIVESKFPQFQASLNTLSLSSMTNVAGSSVILGKDGQKFVQVKTIQKTIAALEGGKKQLSAQITANNGKTTIGQLTSLKSQIESQINSLRGIVAKTGGSGYIPIAGNEDLFVAVRESIRSIQGPTNKDLGDLGELFVSYMLSAAVGMLNDGIEQIMNQVERNIVVSGSRQTTSLSGFGGTINMSMLVERLNSGGKNVRSPNRNQTYRLEDGTIISTRSSQGTVDVSIQLPSTAELQSLFGTNKLNASVKNYTSGIANGIHILSGAPLLSLLMLLNTDFVNHYLNRVVSHSDTSISIGGDMINTMKEAIAVRALTGARNLGNNNFNLSDVFVINAGGRFRVMTTQQLFGKIASDINQFVEVSGLPTGGIQNNYVGSSSLNQVDAQTRITNLLATLHGYKISMSLKPGALGMAAV